MYRFIIVLAATMLILAGCSKPITTNTQDKSAVCQRLSKQMISNDTSMGQPRADSSQITQANLLKEYRKYNCM